MNSFKAYRIHEDDGKINARFEQIGLDDLTDGDVVIRAAYSDINYKDALAATGKGRILRKYPLVGGIDVSGSVVESGSDRFKPGDKVVVCGCELSEIRDGGYAEYARAPADCVVALPPSLSLFDAMALGTAGFTAALAVDRMEQNGQHPGQGPIVVTGATGGVGSVAIDLLSGCGYEVYAYTGKGDASDYLISLGANKILLRQEVDLGKRPMERAEYGGAVDSLGGEVLTWLTRTVCPFGNIASIGLAASHELNTTVMPFILRGVTLAGIDSVYSPRWRRIEAWRRLATDLDPAHLELMMSEIPLAKTIATAADQLAGRTRGRIVVDVNR